MAKCLTHQIWSVLVALQCDNGMEYMPCIDPCKTDRVCGANQSSIQSCGADCVEGCGCPDNKFVQNGHCICETEAKCTDPVSQKMYEQGTQLVTDDCQMWYVLNHGISK
jgi:hypothetical protein